MRDNIVKLALDVGNGKIKFIFGEVNVEGEKLRVIDYIQLPSEGIRRTVVENLDLLSDSIRKGLKEIEERNGREFGEVSLGISSDRVISRTDHGIIEFEEKEITSQDVDDLIASVEKNLLKEDEVVIEHEIYNVRVDDSGILKTPIGHVGKNIQADVHIITIKKEYINPLIQAVNRAGLEVEDLFLNASASAKAVLKPEDRHMGVALIDIGEGVTDIAMYKNDKIIYTKSLSIGGMHFANDISFLLKIPKSEAKEILKKLSENQYTGGVIKTENGEYDVVQLKEIINARVGDFINFISKTIEESGFNGYLGKGLVFTGGAVSIEEILVEVENKMGCVVRKAKPIQLKGFEMEVDPSMSTPIGILMAKLELELKNIQEQDDEEMVQEEIKVEEEEETLEFPINEMAFKQEDFEVKTEEKEKKNKTFNKIGKWFSNFI